jgi:hypothetical protein
VFTHAHFHPTNTTFADGLPAKFGTKHNGRKEGTSSGPLVKGQVAKPSVVFHSVHTETALFYISRVTPLLPLSGPWRGTRMETFPRNACRPTALVRLVTKPDPLVTAILIHLRLMSEYSLLIQEPQGGYGLYISIRLGCPKAIRGYSSFSIGACLKHPDRSSLDKRV